MPQLIVCVRCGKSFPVKPSHAPITKFCSLACVHNRQQSSCAECGIPIMVRPGRVGLNNYCGPTCGRKATAKAAVSRHAEKRQIPDTLHQLYEVERRSTRDIGAMFGVPHITVRRWLTLMGVDVRPGGRGLANRGLSVPSRDSLERWISIEHRGYREVAGMLGIDSTAVPYWLDRYNIPHPAVLDTKYKGKRPILPEPDELRGLYEAGYSLDEIGRRFGVSDGPIRNLCTQYGIPVRESGWNPDRIECKDGHRVRSTYEARVDDWLHEHGIDHVYEPALPFDRRHRGDFLANGWYIEIWGVRAMPRYLRSKEHKRTLYKAHSLPLIEIPAHAFDARRNEMWKRKLHACLTPPVSLLPLLESLA